MKIFLRTTVLTAITMIANGCHTEESAVKNEEPAVNSPSTSDYYAGDCDPNSGFSTTSQDGSLVPDSSTDHQDGTLIPESAYADSTGSVDVTAESASAGDPLKLDQEEAGFALTDKPRRCTVRSEPPNDELQTPRATEVFEITPGADGTSAVRGINKDHLDKYLQDLADTGELSKLKWIGNRLGQSYAYEANAQEVLESIQLSSAFQKPTVEIYNSGDNSGRFNIYKFVEEYNAFNRY